MHTLKSTVIPAPNGESFFRDGFDNNCDGNIDAADTACQIINNDGSRP